MCWLGGARRLTRFSMGSRDPARVISLSNGLGRGRIAKPNPPTGRHGADLSWPPSFWNIRLYAGVTFTQRLFSQPNQREVNDETRSDRYRKRGHFGSDRMGGGGECTTDVPGPRPVASLWPFTDGPYTSLCPTQGPSLCSSRACRCCSRRAHLYPWFRSAA